MFLLLAAGASALADPLPPILNSPASNSTNVGPGIFVSYSLPETPASGSVQLAFSNQLQVLTLQLADNTSAAFVVDPHNPSAAPFVVAVHPPTGTLPDGHYDVWLSYQDPATNTPVVAVVTNFVLDTVTLTPLLLAPSNNAVASSANLLHIQYALPETPLPGSVQISFQNSDTNVILFLNNNRTNDFIVDPHFLLGSTAINSASSSALPDGTFMVILTYQDSLANPAAEAEATNFIVDTVTMTPLLLAPSNNAVITSNSLLHIQYALPEPPAPGSVQISFQNRFTNVSFVFAPDTLTNETSNNITVDPRFLAGSTNIISLTAPAVPDGNYAVKLQYQDATLNPPAEDVDTNVLFQTQYGLQITSVTYSNGMFLMAFTNHGYNETFYMLSTTNLRTPLSNWDNLETTTGAAPGFFQFQDPRSNNPSAFYILRAH